MIASALTFFLNYRRVLLPALGALALTALAWRALDGAYDRGYAAADGKCREASAEAQIAALRRAADEQSRRETISFEAGLKAGAAQRKIETITRTLIEKVPIHVSEKADAACVVPRGFVRLHDAAASGTAVPALPGAAGEPDDSASGIALSEAAAAITGNYGTCHQVRQQLSDLQGWIAAQRRANGP